MGNDNEREIRVKNIDLNIEKDIRFLLANEHSCLLSCKIEETDDECIFHFDTEGMREFGELNGLSLEEKYRLLYNIGGMEDLAREYYVNLSPENLVYDVNLMPKLLLRDKKSDFNNPDFFEQYRALVASVVIHKHTFEQYFAGGAVVPEKSFISKSGNTDELKRELLERYYRENEINKSQKILIKKSKYKSMKYSFPIAIVVVIIASLYGLYMQFVKLPYGNHLINAYGGYLKSDYIYVEDVLKDIKVKDLPTDVKYILARSYIFTEGLTYEQRENLLEYTGINIDTNIFDFWIYLGRGDFKMAEDIAKKIGNNEFLLFTYIKHSAYVKADVNITGEDKAQLTKDLDQKINELSESMTEGDTAESREQPAEEMTEETNEQDNSLQ